MIWLILIISSLLIAILSLALAVAIFNIVALLIIRVPFVNTAPQYLRLIMKEIEIKPGDIVYDLGCGSGDFLRLATAAGAAKGIGWEISPWAFLVAVLKNWNNSRISFRFEDFFKADLSKANLVYVYLLPKMLEKVSIKLERELKPSARVITVGAALPGRKEQKKILLNEKHEYYAYYYKI